ncbi:hypothetical protein [Mycobacterium bohemicum]|nr:hypothetical protein [Mycobacterium bohemicum]
MIHGNSRRAIGLEARIAFEKRGYAAHMPTLRHHELPADEGAEKIADCG